MTDYPIPTAKILVVDDHPGNLLILRKSLGKAGYEVMTAENGIEAVEVASDQRPDLILLDMMMPGRNGLEVCHILKQQKATASIPVIFVTASSDSTKIAAAFSAGGCDYVTKPFYINEILARVAVHVRLRQVERELVQKNEQLEVVAKQLAEINQELGQQARYDPLTQLLNRGAWEESARLEHKRSCRTNSVYSILMIDVDLFKALNDSQGHLAGDDCLRRVARCIASTCRAIDFVGRYGGEEFVVLAPETDYAEACALAERIRSTIWELAISHGSSPLGDRLTVSVGAATGCSYSYEDILQSADEALYAAKQAGRNRVCASEKNEITNHFPSKGSPGRLRIIQNPTTDDREPTVLIVDDNPTNRAVCKGCLSREGYRTREAMDGHGALAEVLHDPPDVIIMDIMMPNMDGLECTRALKENPRTRDIPIIIVSAKSDTADLMAGLEAGAEEYLTKPFRTAELAMRVHSMARLHRGHSALLRSYHLRSEQNRILSLLLEFSRTVGNATDLDEILQHTLVTAAEVSLCQRISIMLPDQDRRYLRIAHSAGIDPQVAQSVHVLCNEGIAGKVFLSKKSVVINTESEAGSRSEVYDTPFFAAIPLVSTPLGTSEETRGVLNVTERIRLRPFEPHEIEYLKIVAHVAGAAIDRILSQQARDQARDSIMIGLAKLAEYRDSNTGKHLDRVSHFSVILAEQLRNTDTFRARIDEAFLHNLQRAVPLHDIGKVAIPDRILNKAGKLSEEDKVIMHTHARVGAETIRSVIRQSPGSAFLEMAAQIAYAHHEWYDGTGYPLGLKEEGIPLAARITALADVYDALTTTRVYKQAYSHDKAFAIVVEGAGSQFDPAIVEAFVQREKDFAALARTSEQPQLKNATTASLPQANPS